MKLLLTSAGLTTSKLQQKLIELAGKPAAQLHVAFIPTAANLEPGDKDWLIKDLRILQDDGYKAVDLVDISALPQKVWMPRIEAADIIFVGGGNTHHLLYWAHQSGFAQELPRLLESRVYVGVSAGSILAGTSLGYWSDEATVAQAIGEDPGNDGLGLVDFAVEPHLGNPDFPEINQERAKTFSQQISKKVYLLDDTSAVVVNGDQFSVIGKENYQF